MLQRSIKDFLKRHWLGVSCLTIVFVWIPEWVSNIWGLYSGEPLFLVMARRFGEVNMPDFSHYWITVPLSVCMFAYIMYLKVTERTLPIRAKVEDKEKRAFVGESITVEYLTGLFSEPDHTTFQGQELTKPFLGKWMKVSVVMKNVSGHNDLVLMNFYLDPNIERLVDANLYLLFRGNEISRVLVIKPGDKITAIGQIYQVGRREFILDNCELIH